MSATTQKRGRGIAMSPEEVDAFLDEERVCRVATVDADGSPQVEPLWFVWADGALWLNSIVRSKRWASLQRDPRVAIVIDTGHDYSELRGVKLLGELVTVGEVPRTGEPHEQLEAVESAFSTKYFRGTASPIDGRHGWLCLRPSTLVSWDFRKAAARKPGVTAETSFSKGRARP